MVWTNLTFNFAAILTNTEMNQLDANFDAVAAGLSGAPNYATAAYDTGIFTAADIGANAARQSEFKTATASQSVLVDSSTLISSELSLTGGDFTLGWWYGINDTFGPSVREKMSHSGQFVANVQFHGSGKTIFVFSRYIQSSPPYNLGEGDIPLFIYAKVNRDTHDVIETSVAEDPPWFAYGPHKLGPEGNYQKFLGVWGETSETIAANPKLRDRVLRRGRMFETLNTQEKTKVIKRPFAQWEKNIDMSIIPHPFSSVNSASEEVFMVNVHKRNIVQDLIMVHKFGVNQTDNLSGLLHADTFKFRPTTRKYRQPPSVTLVDLFWK